MTSSRWIAPLALASLLALALLWFLSGGSQPAGPTEPGGATVDELVAAANAARERGDWASYLRCYTPGCRARIAASNVQSAWLEVSPPPEGKPKIHDELSALLERSTARIGVPPEEEPLDKAGETAQAAWLAVAAGFRAEHQTGDSAKYGPEPRGRGPATIISRAIDEQRDRGFVGLQRGEATTIMALARVGGRWLFDATPIEPDLRRPVAERKFPPLEVIRPLISKRVDLGADPPAWYRGLGQRAANAAPLAVGELVVYARPRRRKREQVTLAIGRLLGPPAGETVDIVEVGSLWSYDAFERVPLGVVTPLRQVFPAGAAPPELGDPVVMVRFEDGSGSNWIGRVAASKRGQLMVRYPADYGANDAQQGSPFAWFPLPADGLLLCARSRTARPMGTAPSATAWRWPATGC